MNANKGVIDSHLSCVSCVAIKRRGSMNQPIYDINDTLY